MTSKNGISKYEKKRSIILFKGKFYVFTENVRKKVFLFDSSTEPLNSKSAMKKGW